MLATITYHVWVGPSAVNPTDEDVQSGVGADYHALHVVAATEKFLARASGLTPETEYKIAVFAETEDGDTIRMEDLLFTTAEEISGGNWSYKRGWLRDWERVSDHEGKIDPHPQYLRSDIDDTAEGKITFAVGAESDVPAIDPDDLVRLQEVEAMDQVVLDTATSYTDDKLTAHVANPNPHVQYLQWRGLWEEGTYPAQSMVRDGDWLMIANTETTDRAGPSTTGPIESDIPDGLSYLDYTDTGVVWSGTEYTFTVGGWLRSISVKAPELTDDTNYRILLFNVTDPDNVDVIPIAAPVLVENDWAGVAVGNSLITPGTVVAVVLDALNSGSDTPISGGWSRAINVNGVVTDPGLGAWGTQNSNASLRINKIDLDSVGRETELMTAEAGTTVVMQSTVDSTRSMAWTINEPATDQGAHISWGNVTYDGNGTGGEPGVGEDCLLSFKVPVPAPTKYQQNTDFWLTNQPTWATCRGLLRLSGIDQPADNDAFGVKIQFQPGFISADWDMASYLGDGLPVTTGGL